MSQIAIAARESDNPFAVDINRPVRWLGTFETTTSQYWCGDGKPSRVEVPGGGYELVDREGERLWHTADGRWVVTNHGGPAYLLTEAEAEQWFVDNDYSAEDRDLYVRSGHIA